MIEICGSFSWVVQCSVLNVPKCVFKDQTSHLHLCITVQLQEANSLGTMKAVESELST